MQRLSWGSLHVFPFSVSPTQCWTNTQWGWARLLVQWEKSTRKFAMFPDGCRMTRRRRQRHSVTRTCEFSLRLWFFFSSSSQSRNVFLLSRLNSLTVLQRSVGQIGNELCFFFVFVFLLRRLLVKVFHHCCVDRPNWPGWEGWGRGGGGNCHRSPEEER